MQIKQRLFRRASSITTAFFVFWILYFFFFWSRVFFVKNGGVWVGNINTWGDWAVHFTMGSASAYRELIPKYHPLLIFAPFSYPFLSNLVSGILIRIGTPFFSAFIAPTFFTCIATIFTLYTFYKTYAKSAYTAILASTLFLLNGGFGFFYFLRTLRLDPSLYTLLNPPHQYTHMPEYFIQWMNVLQIFSSQRTVTLGLPITLVILIATYRVFFNKTPAIFKKTVLILMGLGFLTGIMPIIHMHLFMMVAVTLAWWAGVDLFRHRHSPSLLRRSVLWGILGGTAGVLSTFFFFRYFAYAASAPLIQWSPGWYVHNGQQNIIIFWLWNWGLIPLLAGIGFFLIPKLQKLLFLPFFAFFLLVNLFVYAPFIWDNTKVLVFVSIGFSYLAAQTLIHISRRSLLWQTAAIGVFLLSIASGSIEAVRMQNMTLDAREMFSGEEIELANWVRENTLKNAIFLVGDKHNHFVPTLTGRPIIMGFRGWLKTYGMNYTETERDTADMFSGKNLNKLFKKYQVQYVVIGPYEKEVWKAENNTFKNFPVAKQTSLYTIYQVGSEN